MQSRLFKGKEALSCPCLQDSLDKFQELFCRTQILFPRKYFTILVSFPRKYHIYSILTCPCFLLARGLLQDSILVSNAQKMSNRAEVTFKIRLNKIVENKQTGVMLLSFLFVIPLVRRGRDGGSRVWSNMWGQVVRSKKPGCRHRVRGRDYRAYYRAFTSSANFALLRTKMPVVIKFGVKRLIIRLKICILGKRCPPHCSQKIYKKEDSLEPQV